MKGKLAFVLGAAVGYVLGSRAGRERYEQIKSGAQKLWNTAPVQRGVAAAKSAVGTRVDDLKAVAMQAGKDAFANLTKGSGSQQSGSARAAADRRPDETQTSTKAEPAAGEAKSSTSTSSDDASASETSSGSTANKPAGSAAAGKSGTSAPGASKAAGGSAASKAAGSTASKSGGKKPASKATGRASSSGSKSGSDA